MGREVVTVGRGEVVTVGRGEVVTGVFEGGVFLCGGDRL